MSVKENKRGKKGMLLVGKIPDVQSSMLEDRVDTCSILAQMIELVLIIIVSFVSY